MDDTQGRQLENDFLNLLLEADPKIANHPEFAKEFARHLADFADVWATKPEKVASQEHWISKWVESYSESTPTAVDTDSDVYSDEETDDFEEYSASASDYVSEKKEALANHDDEEGEEAAAS